MYGIIIILDIVRYFNNWFCYLIEVKLYRIKFEFVLLKCIGNNVFILKYIRNYVLIKKK